MASLFSVIISLILSIIFAFTSMITNLKFTITWLILSVFGSVLSIFIIKMSSEKKIGARNVVNQTDKPKGSRGIIVGIILGTIVVAMASTLIYASLLIVLLNLVIIFAIFASAIVAIMLLVLGFPKKREKVAWKRSWSTRTLERQNRLEKTGSYPRITRDELKVSTKEFKNAFDAFFPKGWEGHDYAKINRLARKKIWMIRVVMVGIIVGFFLMIYAIVSAFGIPNYWILVFFTFIAFIRFTVFMQSRLERKYWQIENDILSLKLDEFVSGMRQCGLDPKLDPDTANQTDDMSLPALPSLQCSPSHNPNSTKVQQFMQQKLARNSIQLSSGFYVTSSPQTEEQYRYTHFLSSAESLELNIYKHMEKHSKWSIIILILTLIVTVPLVTLSQQSWWVIVFLSGLAISLGESYRALSKAKTYVQTLIAQGKLPLTKIKFAAFHDAYTIFSKIRTGNIVIKTT